MSLLWMEYETEFQNLVDAAFGMYQNRGQRNDRARETTNVDRSLCKGCKRFS